MGKQPPVRLILASSSPARRALLTRAGYAFEVMPSHVDEPTAFSDPRTMVQHVAWLKAAAVAPRVSDGIVLAADTVGWVAGQAIGKPADAADAHRIIRLLSGTKHELWTGVVLWRRPDDIQLAWQEVSRVAVKLMTDLEIDTYVHTRTWQGCSGAYAIQEENDPYITVTEGTVSNVIGLPMESLERLLSQVT
jgi:septum formation protein